MFKENKKQANEKIKQKINKEVKINGQLSLILTFKNIPSPFSQQNFLLNEPWERRKVRFSMKKRKFSM